MLSGYTQQRFSDNGLTRPLHSRGDGPPVIVMHEVPGITPQVLRFADWLVDAGFRVHLPELLGQAGRPITTGYMAASLAKVCISREFSVLAAHRSSPITDWLRALVRKVHAESGGRGVGAIGMCLTGNFALSMMLEPALMAPVLSQPSLPLGLTPALKRALHVSPQEWQCVKQRCANGDKVLGLRFHGDPMSPPQRFETLRRELGDAFEGIEIDPRDAGRHPASPVPHSVVTTHLIDREGEPTKLAADRVIAFFRERLQPAG